MMRTFITLAARSGLVAAGALLACSVSAQAMSPEDLYRTISPSIWLVRALDADGVPVRSGSAVVTAPETLLTNCHVLRQAKRIVISNDNVQHGARLQHIDVERDLCQITARNLRAPAVPIGETERLAVGQKVYALGNPLGIERTLSDGLISALHRTEQRRELVMIQTSAPISPGSSGGGLFDAQGRLIGITTSQTREGQNINFAIPIDWMRDLAARSDAALASVAVPPTVATRPATPSSGTWGPPSRKPSRSPTRAAAGGNARARPAGPRSAATPTRRCARWNSASTSSARAVRSTRSTTRSCSGASTFVLRARRSLPSGACPNENNISTRSPSRC
jgi:serine protease Do